MPPLVCTRSVVVPAGIVTLIQSPRPLLCDTSPPVRTKGKDVAFTAVVEVASPAVAAAAGAVDTTPAIEKGPVS
jgi:hypothetical protein